MTLDNSFENLARAHCLSVVLMLAPMLLFPRPLRGEESAPPERYVLNYPVAQQFCPPVDSYADDVQEAIQKIGGRTIRHQLNGGYGLPVVIMVGNQNVLHLGADVAWYRVGAPVYAIADGVVRISQGAVPNAETAAKADKQKNTKSNQPPGNSVNQAVEIQNSPLSGDVPLAPDNSMGTKTLSQTPNQNSDPANADRAAQNARKPPENKPATGLPPALGWGNVIAIEHRLLDGSYVTSIYGHLGSARRVSVGDVVQAGQMIGVVGKSGPENGGFKPHLHFGLRAGRLFEPQRNLFTVVIQGKPGVIKLASLEENEVELETPNELPLPLELTFGNHKFTISAHDGKQ